MATVTIVGCDRECRVDPEAVAESVTPETVLVSVMFVNNETGAIQDIAAIADAVRRRNPRTLVHTDAVQALGRIPFHPAELRVDLMSVSAHKLYGPKGVGALWIRHGVVLAAQNTGGGQERNRRSATENVAGIVGSPAPPDVHGQGQATHPGGDRSGGGEPRHWRHPAPGRPLFVDADGLAAPARCRGL